MQTTRKPLTTSGCGPLNVRRTTAGFPGRDSAHMHGGAPLTARQLDVLRVVENYLSSRGWPPSLRELGEAIGTSRNAADKFLDALATKGYLRRDAREHRGLCVLIPSSAAVVVEPRPLRKAQFCPRCRREVGS